MIQAFALWVMKGLYEQWFWLRKFYVRFLSYLCEQTLLSYQYLQISEVQLFSAECVLDEYNYTTAANNTMY